MVVFLMMFHLWFWKEFWYISGSWASIFVVCSFTQIFVMPPFFMFFMLKFFRCCFRITLDVSFLARSCRARLNWSLFSSLSLPNVRFTCVLEYNWSSWVFNFSATLPLGWRHSTYLPSYAWLSFVLSQVWLTNFPVFYCRFDWLLKL